MIKAALEWALARGTEVSTWVGIATMVPALAVHANIYATIAATIASIALVLVKERRPITAGVVIQDAEPVVARAVSNSVGCPGFQS